MRGDALQKQQVGSIEGSYDSPLHLFAGVLLLTDGRDEELQTSVADARAVAATAVSAGRAGVDEETVVAYRTLYRTMRERAAGTRASGPGGAGPRWRRSVDALAALRHRQRAVLALYYCVGLTMAQVAAVIGVREGEARRVVEAGIASLVRALPEPVDVRRALRAAGVRLVQRAPWPLAVGPGPSSASGTAEAPPEEASGVVPVTLPTEPLPEPVAVPEPVRLPRGVVRALLAEPIAADAVAGSVLPGTRSAVPAPPPDAPVATPPIVVVARPARLLRALLAAALGVGLVVAFTGTTVERRPAAGDPTIARTPSMALLERVAARSAVPARPADVGATVVVRPGDSLWRIAARDLGDGRRWSELWRLNRGRMLLGEVFRDPDLIKPGWVLRRPSG